MYNNDMAVCAHACRLDIDAERFRRLFNHEPVEFSHNLSGLDLFKIESLYALAEIMSEHPDDYAVTAGASSGGTNFFSVPMMPYKAHEAIENLDRGAFRILLKRPENHDSRFKELMIELYRQVEDLLGLHGEKLARLEAGILITSAATITPFHYDPEVGMFSHIEGEKIYHVYSPAVIRETELERNSICGPVALAPVELIGRDPSREHVFRLSAGKGFHQPHNAPHWVETGSSRSISYTFVFETEAMRAVARTRAFNHYLRKLRVTPASLGAHPAIDAVKADVMRAVIPARGAVARVVNNSPRLTRLKRAIAAAV